jgi:hypothetical protein
MFRTFLVFAVSLAIIAAWDVAVRIYSSIRQREDVEAIEKLGGSPDYGYDSFWLPWKPVFGNLYRVRLDGLNMTDAGLTSLTPHLKKLTHLIQLSLINSQITDAGLEHLEELTQLQYLSLAGNPITDAGLERLKGLTRLQWLSLDGTKVTDAGVKKLEQALPKCKIQF